MTISRRSFLQGVIAIAVVSIFPGGGSVAIEDLPDGKEKNCRYPEVIKIMEDRLRQLFFEPNDMHTRYKWCQLVQDDLHREFITNRKFFNFRVVCNEINNPDLGKFVGEVFVQPSPLIEVLVYKISA